MSEKSTEKSKKTTSRPQRENVKGLPEHAQFQNPESRTGWLYNQPVRHFLSVSTK